MEPELLLHHYDASPYSEKVRAALGYKGLAWRSVPMPPVLPKPELFVLTGGYRRAPVLQIGADLYCDSTLILEEIERRYPTPAFARGADAASAALLGRLVDVDLFWRFVRYVMGLRASALPAALLEDRKAMHPHLDLDRDALAASVPGLAVHLALVLEQLDEALVGRDFLGGTSPAMGDFAVYHALWFLRGVRGLETLAPGAKLLGAWMARIAAFGHGTSTPFTASEAIGVASRFEPAPLPASDDPAPAYSVRVAPEGYPREAVEGRLRFTDARSLVLARESNATGLLHIHFPLLGYATQRIDA